MNLLLFLGKPRQKGAKGKRQKEKNYERIKYFSKHYLETTFWLPDVVHCALSPLPSLPALSLTMAGLPCCPLCPLSQTSQSQQSSNMSPSNIMQPKHLNPAHFRFFHLSQCHSLLQFYEPAASFVDPHLLRSCCKIFIVNRRQPPAQLNPDYLNSFVQT